MITEKFVEECMWTPKMMFLNVIGMTNHKSNSATGSTLTFFLFRNGTVISYRRNSRLTFSCGMEFSNFPFEGGVFAEIFS